MYRWNKDDKNKSKLSNTSFKLKLKIYWFWGKTPKEVTHQVLKEKIPADIKDNFLKCISDQQGNGYRLSIG